MKEREGETQQRHLGFVSKSEKKAGGPDEENEGCPNGTEVESLILRGSTRCQTCDQVIKAKPSD